MSADWTIIQLSLFTGQRFCYRSDTSLGEVVGRTFWWIRNALCGSGINHHGGFVLFDERRDERLRAVNNHHNSSQSIQVLERTPTSAYKVVVR